MGDYLTVLEKHRDDTPEGHVYWDVVYSFLESKGFGVEWEDHLNIHKVPYDWGYFDTDSKNKKTSLSETYRLAAKVRALLTGEEFYRYRVRWLSELRTSVIEIDFESMRSTHDGDFPPISKKRSKAKATEK